MNAPRNRRSEFKERELGLHESRLLVHEAQQRLPEIQAVLGIAYRIAVQPLDDRVTRRPVVGDPNTVPGATFQFVLPIEPSGPW